MYKSSEFATVAARARRRRACKRLVRWLERFKGCLGHIAQRMALQTDVQGVFSDSARKSMQAMRARVTHAVSYQAFQHFITHATWNARQVWRQV